MPEPNRPSPGPPESRGMTGMIDDGRCHLKPDSSQELLDAQTSLSAGSTARCCDRAWPSPRASGSDRLPAGRAGRPPPAGAPSISRMRNWAMAEPPALRRCLTRCTKLSRRTFDEVVDRAPGPGLEVNPAAVAAMAEVGIDIAREFPKPWTEEIVKAADVVVTMGCGDACPLYPGKRYEDWELEDPRRARCRRRPRLPRRDPRSSRGVARFAPALASGLAGLRVIEQWLRHPQHAEAGSALSPVCSSPAVAQQAPSEAIVGASASTV